MASYAVDNWMTSPPPSASGLIYHPRRTPSSGGQSKRQRSRSRSGALQCLAGHQIDDDEDDDWYRAAPEPHWSPRSLSAVTSSPFRVTSSSSTLFRSANYSFHHGEDSADCSISIREIFIFQGDVKVTLIKQLICIPSPFSLVDDTHLLTCPGPPLLLN